MVPESPRPRFVVCAEYIAPSARRSEMMPFKSHAPHSTVSADVWHDPQRVGRGGGLTCIREARMYCCSKRSIREAADKDLARRVIGLAEDKKGRRTRQYLRQRTNGFS